MKARFVISAVVASLTAILGGAITERAGDPSVEISATEQRLDRLFAPKQIVDRVIETAPSGLSREQFDALVATELRKAGVDTQASLSGNEVPAWNDVEATWERLTWQNRQIAMAKAMSHYDSSPDQFESYVWNERSTIAARPWQVEERSQFSVRRYEFAVLGAAGGFTVCFVVLLFLSWFWAFFLARLREVSDAIKGK